MMPRDKIYSSIFLMLVLVLGFVSYPASFPSIGLVFADDDDKKFTKNHDYDDDDDDDDKKQNTTKIIQTILILTELSLPIIL